MAGRRGRPRDARQPAARFKQADSLVFYFRLGTFRCRNYFTDTEVEASSTLIDVLAALVDWRTAVELRDRLPAYSDRSIDAALESLVAHTLVVRAGTAEARAEARLAAWQAWGPSASFFHFGTKRAFRRRPFQDEARFNRARLRILPQPPAVKSYPAAPRHDLAPPAVTASRDFLDVLLERRTNRTFGRAPVSVDELGTLLYYAFGFRGHKAWPGLGRVPLRTSPSGGARQVLEAYCVALRVGGLRRGLYHYRPDLHRLEHLSAAPSARRLGELCGHQEWIGRAAFVVLLTAVLPRMTWRYDSARAYRVVLLEAGHFGQTFCLASTWLGLRPFQTAALDDERLEALLGVDGGSETVVYALGAGSRGSRAGSRRR
ncbi:MAG: SagB/ThcOx family dehydrogenase [Vicinamibacterales bacterium]